jgi:hypothetical protein
VASGFSRKFDGGTDPADTPHERVAGSPAARMR